MSRCMNSLRLTYYHIENEHMDIILVKSVFSRHISEICIFQGISMRQPVSCPLLTRDQIWAQSGSDWPQMGQIRGVFSCCEIWCEKVCDLSHLCPIWPSLWPSLPLMLNESIQMKYRYSETYIHYTNPHTQVCTTQQHVSYYNCIRQEQNSTYKCQHTSIGEMIQHIIWTQNKTILSYYTFFRLHKMKKVRTHYKHHQWKNKWKKKNIFWWDIRMEALHIKPHLPTVLETVELVDF